MRRVKGTALAVAFAPDQRDDLENDLAIVRSIVSRLNGAFRPGPNSAICVFQSVIDCVQTAAAAIDWFTRTERGLRGVGMGIEAAADVDAASRLAECGLTHGEHNVFIMDTIYAQIRGIAGLEFEEIVASTASGQDGQNRVYGMMVQPQGFAGVVNAALSDDTAGWDAEAPSVLDGVSADLDQTVMVLAEDGAPSAEPAPEGDETILALDPQAAVAGGGASPAGDLGDETVLNLGPSGPAVDAANTGAGYGAAEGADAAALNRAGLPRDRDATEPDDISALRAALVLMEQCEAAAHQSIGRGEIYMAVYEIDRILTNDAMANLAGLEGPLEMLQAKRAEYLADAWISTGLMISGEDVNLSIHRGGSLMIGRDPGYETPGAKLGCQTISRIPRQLRIDRHGQAHTVTDLGSSNGSFLDEAPLAANRSVPLDRLEQGMILALGGVLNPPEKGACRLHLSTGSEASPNLSIRVDTTHLNEASRTQLRAEWPDMDHDCATRWVVGESQILIGTGDGCGLRLKSAPNTDPVARIEWTGQGYILAPMTDQVALNGAPVLRPVAIADGVRLTILEQEFQIRNNGG